MKKILSTLFVITLLAVFSVKVADAQKPGDTIVGQYTYYDAEGDLEGQSIFNWYRDGVMIQGAHSLSYTITAEDAGKTLIFEVIPVSITGISPGNPIRSAGIVVEGASSGSNSGGVLPLPTNSASSTPVITYATSTASSTHTTPNVSFNSFISPIDGKVLACAPFNNYLKLNSNANNKEEVKMWQAFLNKEMGTNIPLTGYFGSMTLSATKAFQAKYAAEVLTPWDISSPTGYVYKSTRYKANKILGCTELPVTLDNGTVLNY